MFCMNARPMTAALLRNDACTNAPLMDWSRKNTFATPHIIQKQAVLASAQKRTYLRSNTARTSTPEMSRKSMAGSVTEKLNLFAAETNCSVSIPVRRSA